MKIAIIGAGPVGLLLACLLANRHRVTIYEKRAHFTRYHSLNISELTLNEILSFLRADQLSSAALQLLIERWLSQTKKDPYDPNDYQLTISTNEIETALLEIAQDLNVIIKRDFELNHLTVANLREKVIIGADGAHSSIRQLFFDNQLTEVETIHYLAQLKYQTSGSTKNRGSKLTILACLLNSLTDSNTGITFESLAPPNDNLIKSGTLNIPISATIYHDLTENNKGSYANPWSLSELAAIQHKHSIKTLVAMIKRYELGLKLRGGWLHNPLITALPLKIYRSQQVSTITELNQLILLVGDAAAGLIFERGLNKGWLEAIKCAGIFLCLQPEVLTQALKNYDNYCRDLYRRERSAIYQKYRQIRTVNQTSSIVSSAIASSFSRATRLAK